MLGKRQYSIRFLLVEILLVSLSLALIRQGLIWGGGARALCVIAALFVIGAALGRLLGSMATGIALTVAGIVIGALFMPA